MVSPSVALSIAYDNVRKGLFNVPAFLLSLPVRET